MQSFEIDRLALVGVREASKIGHQLVARLRAGLFQRRQRGLRLRELGALRKHVRYADGAEIEALLKRDRAALDRRR